jgi:hypothetical protein
LFHVFLREVMSDDRSVTGNGRSYNPKVAGTQESTSGTQAAFHINQDTNPAHSNSSRKAREYPTKEHPTT